MKQEQKIMLEIFTQVRNILEKENIKYWLDAGTLLGAVRHKGFIPWDDDIDIAVLEEDMKVIIDLLKEKLNKNYECDEKYYNEFGFLKIRSKKNFLINNNGEKEGIFIDIFPFYKYKKKSGFYEKNISRIYSYKKFNKTSLNGASILKKLIIILASIIPEKIYKYLLTEKIQGEEYLGYSLFTGFYKRIKKEDIFPLKKIEFENEIFLCPQNYHLYLKEYYGDYMKLPEESKRYTHSVGSELESAE